MIRPKFPNIEAERARNGLSIELFARHLGITRKTYFNWCHRGKIPQEKLVIMADLFHVSIDYLLKVPSATTKTKTPTLERGERDGG